MRSTRLRRCGAAAWTAAAALLVLSSTGFAVAGGMSARPPGGPKPGRVAVRSAAPAPATRDTVKSTALANGAAVAQVRRGDLVSVPVVLDLTGANAHGDLGATQFELAFPEDLLQFVSATPGVTGAAQSHLAGPGRLRFAFASTAPQGKSRLTLATFSFRVAPAATAGRRGSLHLSYTARPVTTGFQPLDLPMSSGSVVHVVP